MLSIVEVLQFEAVHLFPSQTAVQGFDVAAVLRGGHTGELLAPAFLFQLLLGASTSTYYY
jgi:hypothetical protein